MTFSPILIGDEVEELGTDTAGASATGVTLILKEDWELVNVEPELASFEVEVIPSVS